VNEEKKKKSHRSVLPSNWDRYGEEEDDSTPEIASKTLDVVLPKSKGADYRHLVAEAQSHAETSLEGFPAFDDLLLGMCFSRSSLFVIVHNLGAKLSVISWNVLLVWD